MKAVAVFRQQKKIELVEHPEPEPSGELQVMVRVLEVGICGTDREIATFEYGAAPAGEEYLVLGHEALGEVVNTGRGVTGLKTGDLVIPTVRRMCGEVCPACAMGRQDFCYTGGYRERGIVRYHGFLTEMIAEDHNNLSLVPAALRDVAVLAEPLTVTEKAFDQLVAIQRRLPWLRMGSVADGRKQCALILGAGPVGLLAAMKFKTEGFDVYVYSRGSERIKPPLVAAIGCTFIDAEAADPEELGRLCGPIDVVYEAMGAADIAFRVLLQLGPNAVFVFTGIPRHAHPVAIDTSALLYQMVLRNQVVFGTVNASPSHFQAAIRDLAVFHQEFPAATRELITNRYRIEEYAEPLASSHGIKNVIVM